MWLTSKEEILVDTLVNDIASKVLSCLLVAMQLHVE